MPLSSGLTTYKNTIFVYLFFGFWLLVWMDSMTIVWDDNKEYYRFAFGASLEKLREYHSSFDQTAVDFYRILKFCDQRLPAHEELQIILSTKNQYEFQYLREKARYFLYPRNYGDNITAKNFILVYKNDNFGIPDGYEILAFFGENKYLLKKSTHGSGSYLK